MSSIVQRPRNPYTKILIFITVNSSRASSLIEEPATPLVLTFLCLQAIQYRQSRSGAIHICCSASTATKRFRDARSTEAEASGCRLTVRRCVACSRSRGAELGGLEALFDGGYLGFESILMISMMQRTRGNGTYTDGSSPSVCPDYPVKAPPSSLSSHFWLQACAPQWRPPSSDGRSAPPAAFAHELTAQDFSLGRPSSSAVLDYLMTVRHCCIALLSRQD